MYDTLYQYLILHRKISLPGIGTITLQRYPSLYNVVEKAFAPPTYAYVFNNDAGLPPRKMLDWVAHVKKVPEWDAVALVNDFAGEIKDSLDKGKEVNWDPIGVFRKNSGGAIVLESFAVVPEGEEPVYAEKVIRQKAQHTMLVGERERTSSEMEVMLGTPSRKKKQREVILKQARAGNFGMTVAIVIMVLALLVIGVYFSQVGFKPGSAGNRNQVSPVETPQ